MGCGGHQMAIWTASINIDLHMHNQEQIFWSQDVFLRIGVCFSLFFCFIYIVVPSIPNTWPNHKITCISNTSNGQIAWGKKSRTCRRGKEWSNYKNSTSITLNLSEGCKGILWKLLQKKEETKDLSALSLPGSKAGLSPQGQLGNDKRRTARGRPNAWHDVSINMNHVDM